MGTADPVEILRRLAAGQVETIVVGMAAGVLRGAPVTTVDSTSFTAGIQRTSHASSVFSVTSMRPIATTRVGSAQPSHTW
jgi:hypothetical protein